MATAGYATCLIFFNGELFGSLAPHILHQSAAGKIHVQLEAWSRQTDLGKPFHAPGVIFSPNDAVIPDVVWISKERLANGIDEAGHLVVRSELMVEILSPGERNEQRDKEFKLKLYPLCGVQEYWIVNWQLRTMEVYRRNETRLELLGTLLSNDSLQSPILPGFLMPMERVFV